MILQAVVSVLIIILVLLQFGKGAEAGLMTAASDSVFTSSQQGNILSKMTVVLAVIFLGNSIRIHRMGVSCPHSWHKGDEFSMKKKLKVTEKICPNCGGNDPYCTVCWGSGKWYTWDVK